MSPPTQVISMRCGGSCETQYRMPQSTSRVMPKPSYSQVPSLIPIRHILLQVKFASVDRVALQELGFNYFSTNDKMMGSVTTQQFQQPRFGQLTRQDDGTGPSSVNFADLC
jgi:hypothetical protein